MGNFRLLLFLKNIMLFFPNQFSIVTSLHARCFCVVCFGFAPPPPPLLYCFSPLASASRQYKTKFNPFEFVKVISRLLCFKHSAILYRIGIKRKKNISECKCWSPSLYKDAHPESIYIYPTNIIIREAG